MNKIILILMFLASPLFSQYTLVVKLVESNGTTPNTGEAANIEWTKYPHSYPTDVISGITTTEAGVTGTYKSKGFTDYQYAKMWLSGVAYAAFDSVITGNIQTWLASNYFSLNTTQSSATGSKGTSGVWVNQGRWDFYDARISTSSGLYPYSPGSTNFVWKIAADSLYGPAGNFFKISSKIYMTGSSKIWGIGGTTPIALSGGSLTFTTDAGLSVTTPVNYDSVTIREDTTISETTLYKTWSLQRRHWSQRDSSDIAWIYTNTLTNTADSFKAINNVYDSYNTGWSIALSSSYANIDTVVIGKAGYYQFTFTVYARFAPTVTSASDKIDTVWIGLKDASVGGASLVSGSDVFAAHSYNNTVQTGGVVCITSTVFCYVAADNQIFYIRSRNLVNNGIVANHTIERSQLTAILIR